MNTGLKAEPESRGRGTEMAKGKLEATSEVRKL